MWVSYYKIIQKTSGPHSLCAVQITSISVMSHKHVGELQDAYARRASQIWGHLRNRSGEEPGEWGLQGLQLTEHRDGRKALGHVYRDVRNCAMGSSDRMSLSLNASISSSVGFSDT